MHETHLVREFTDLYPGYMKLGGFDSRRFTGLKPWPVTYAYAFQPDNRFGKDGDPDNPVEYCITAPFSPDEKTCLSRLDVERPGNPPRRHTSLGG